MSAIMSTTDGPAGQSIKADSANPITNPSTATHAPQKLHGAAPDGGLRTVATSAGAINSAKTR